MRRTGLWRILFCLLPLSPVAADGDGIDDGAFRHPPKEQRPETWFHLIGGNVSKEGLCADLDAIRDAGMSGIQLFHGKSDFGAWPGVTNQIECLSEQWDDMIRFVADGCKARGLSFKMQNCPGWSMSGGPWITPTNAMRTLLWSRTDLEGGGRRSVGLPLPDGVREEDKNRDWRDLFVLAFPTPHGDNPLPLTPDSVVTNDSDRCVSRTFRFAEPVCVRSVEIPSQRQMNWDWPYALEASVSVNGGLETAIPQGCWQDGRIPFTVAVKKGEPRREWTVEVRHRQPVSVPFIRLYSAVRMYNWEGKAGWVLRGSGEDCAGASAVESSDSCERCRNVVDLTDCFSNGKLTWTFPDGAWTVLRIGHANTMARNGPAPEEARGWECDKMSPKGVEANFAGYIGRLVGGVLSEGRLDGMVVDSWECGRQMWTDGMEETFAARRGYPLRAKMPALFGWIVGSPEETESFLRDWRRTVGELIERNYYGRMAELAHAAGLEVQYETAFGDVIPGDILAYWKHCDTPMTEFWCPRDEAGTGSDDFKPIIPCASAAHVYGKRRVAAEAFTNTRLSWREELRKMKPCANHAFARGVTHLVFHTYTHNPRTDALPPGTSFGTRIGQPFLRGQTWWRHMPEFTEWAARCGTMLEAGIPENDILWFLGEDVDHKPHEKSPFPHGYKYDYVNRDALLERISVKDGLFVTPEGVSWRVLWAPCRYMTDEVRMRLDAFAASGGRVVYGTAAEVVRGIRPDVVVGPDEKDRVISDWRRGEEQVEWTHRRDDGSDWYFVAANNNDAYSGVITFRAEGDAFIYDPADGSISCADARPSAGGGVAVRLDLAPAESVFVMFRRGGGGKIRLVSCAVGRKSVPIGEWQVSFPSGWGAPENVAMSRLCSWTELPIGEEGRHFSGTATYTTKFRGTAGKRTTLDLGEVLFAATVFVNGKRVGSRWSPPYRFEIGDFVADGVNEVVVEVTSSWFNRLVYDAGLPEGKRKTWTIPYSMPSATDVLEPSGLLGPVSTTVWGLE